MVYTQEAKKYKYSHTTPPKTHTTRTHHRSVVRTK